MTKTVTGVFLSRFSPLHKGHQLVIDKMIADFGSKNCLLIIGSSTSVNSRTPYTLAKRKAMLKTLYPKIKILTIPDVNPKKNYFGQETLTEWLGNLKKLERRQNTEFVFYGGSKKDVSYLNKEFKTLVAVNRKVTNISATNVRKALETNDLKVLERYLDKRIIPVAKRVYSKIKS